MLDEGGAGGRDRLASEQGQSRADCFVKIDAGFYLAEGRGRKGHPKGRWKEEEKNQRKK